MTTTTIIIIITTMIIKNIQQWGLALVIQFDKDGAYIHPLQWGGLK